MGKPGFVDKRPEIRDKRAGKGSGTPKRMIRGTKGYAAAALALAALAGFAAAAAPRLFSPQPPPDAAAAVGVAPAAVKPAASLPPVAGPAGRPLVVIDPGHGGHDPGAVPPEADAREKEVTLALARALRERLLAGGRVRVALTRDDDRFLLLAERHGIAQRLRAGLFVSIHADSAGDSAASGATVYTLSEVASDREAARLAQRENRADILNGVDLGAESRQVTSILIDLALRETMGRSAAFAALLRRETAPLVPFRDEAHRFAGLVVLKAPDVPSVLFEAGYLSNEADRARLASPEGQAAVAQGVARAIETHFARVRGGGRA